jgi:murein DD-endopeptidase MepM/ murein hydrolase activator NlpD
MSEQVGITANGQLHNPHPKTRMRRLVKLAAFLIVTFLLLTITGAGGLLTDKIVFYGRIAKLYTQEPDTKLAMPLEDVRKKEISDTWQAARGDGRKHEGQDIFATRGTPILSATTGYIYKIGEDNLGGQTVSIIGKGGRVYYYAHLDSYARGIKIGDRVTTRTVLGYVGTTGNAQGTPPHLHFGVYTSSGAINPLPMLTDRLPPAVTRQETSIHRLHRLVL